MSASGSRPSSTSGSATWTTPACWSTRSAGCWSATEGRLGAPEPSLRDALANLRMTFADVSAHLEAHPDGDPADADDPEDSGILRPPSGLWVPGQD